MSWPNGPGPGRAGPAHLTALVAPNTINFFQSHQHLRRPETISSKTPSLPTSTKIGIIIRNWWPSSHNKIKHSLLYLLNCNKKNAKELGCNEEAGGRQRDRRRRLKPTLLYLLNCNKRVHSKVAAAATMADVTVARRILDLAFPFVFFVINKFDFRSDFYKLRRKKEKKVSIQIDEQTGERVDECRRPSEQSENVKREDSVVGKLLKEMIEYEKEQIITFNPSHTF
ncbi:hypothetical protein QL285_074447 [Trifolium repens]|nr:hypothetical protein QL285_074447 [Trifolium repens]